MDRIKALLEVAKEVRNDRHYQSEHWWDRNKPKGSEP
jgi:hypothetical protein